MLDLIHSDRERDFPFNCGDYSRSALAHLIAALFLSPDQAMAMFSVYCDASGKDETDLLVVSGFIASAEEWLHFEKQWNLTLKEFGVQYLHMNEFAHSIKQFDGWKNDESKRRTFLTRLSAVIESRVQYWVGACLIKADYLTVDSYYQLHERLFPYPLCGVECVKNVERWRKAHNIDSSIEYIFERGDEHRGQLMDAVENIVGAAPIFRDKLKFPALQAADFAAYEMYSAFKQYRVDTHKLFERIRISFGLLANIPHFWGDFNEQTLRVFCRLQGIPRR